MAVSVRILLPRSMRAFQRHGLERHQCELAADPAQDLLAYSKLGLALQIGDGYSEGNARAHVHAGMYSGTAEPGAMIKRTDMKLTSYFAFAPYLDHRTSKRYR